MSLATLPDLVLDEIVRWIAIGRAGCTIPREYLSLSRSCKALHEAANRFLYRDPCPCSYRYFLQSLIRLPSNAKFVRYLTVDDQLSFTVFNELWSRVPLRLCALNLLCSERWWSKADTVRKFIASTRPDVQVEQLLLRFGEVTYASEEIYLLRNFGMFNGLEFLEIHLDVEFGEFEEEGRPVGPQHVVDNLDCPRLQHLCIVYDKDDYIIDLGTKLPSLRSFRRVRGEFNDELYELPVETYWDFYTAMMNRGVYFTFGTLGELGCAEFYSGIIRHASKNNLDPEPLLKWALLSDHDHQLQTHQRGQIEAGLHEPFFFQAYFESPNLPSNVRHRKARLDCIPFFIPNHAYFEFPNLPANVLLTALDVLNPVWPQVNTELYFNYIQFTPAIANVLPAATTSLTVITEETVDSTFPACIAALPQLRRLEVFVFHGAQGITGCTKAPMPRPKKKDGTLGGPLEGTLTLAREGAQVGGSITTSWEIAWESGSSTVYWELPRGSELEIELRSWFALNNTLREICFNCYTR
jgi:hypothetical protein